MWVFRGFSICVLLSGAFVPGPALAQSGCPSGAEALSRGVTVAFDGIEITFQHGPNGQILETERHDGDPEVWLYRSDPTGMIHEAWTETAGGAVNPDTRETYLYEFASGLPIAQPGSRWTGREVSVIGGVEEVNTVTWSFSKLQRYSIGSCTYDAIGVRETRTSPTDAQQIPWISQYVHLVDLGFAIFLGGEEEGTDPNLDLPTAIFSSTKVD